MLRHGIALSLITSLIVACGGGSGGADNAVEVNGSGVFIANKESIFRQELYRFDTVSAGTVKLSEVVNNFVTVLDFKISPDGTRVAYRADQDFLNRIELYVAAMDGSNVDKINPPMIANGDVEEYQWSPDGTQVVYTADAEQDEVDEVYLADADGGNHAKINGFVGGPPAMVELFDIQWSPDGRYISQMVRSLGTSLNTGINTHDTQNLTPQNSTRINPTLAAGESILSYAWAADASRVAYLADQDTDEVFELYSATADGSNNDKLNDTLVADGDVLEYTWAPDSSRVAYRADQASDEIFELYTATPDGSGTAVNLNGALAAGGNVLDYSWAPDSSRVAYRADQDTVFLIELYSATPDGSGTPDKLNVALTHADGDVFDYSWAPDSSHVAYRAAPDAVFLAELYSATSDGSSKSKLSGMLPGGGLNGGDVISFVWATNSSGVAYLADQDTDQVFELYSATFDGSSNNKLSGAPLPGGGGRVTTYDWAP